MDYYFVEIPKLTQKDKPGKAVQQNKRVGSHLRLVNFQRDELKLTRTQTREAETYIFVPKNDLEALAIALAQEGIAGWKGSLYSLNYYDCYLEHTCFIFATRGEYDQDQEWLLVAFNNLDRTKYWIKFGNRPLSEVYFAWAKVVNKTHCQFNDFWK